MTFGLFSILFFRIRTSTMKSVEKWKKSIKSEFKLTNTQNEPVVTARVDSKENAFLKSFHRGFPRRSHHIFQYCRRAVFLKYSLIKRVFNQQLFLFIKTIQICVPQLFLQLTEKEKLESDCFYLLHPPERGARCCSVNSISNFEPPARCAHLGLLEALTG